MGYLRILLALCVAVGHLPSGLYGTPSKTIIFVGALVAVKLFFIISGFYMAMIFHKHYSTAPMFLLNPRCASFSSLLVDYGVLRSSRLLVQDPICGIVH